MDIRTFHRYNRLVKRGLVRPLACPRCDQEYALRATEDADPILQCFTCGTKIQPGLNLYNQVRAVVSEHFVTGE